MQALNVHASLSVLQWLETGIPKDSDLQVLEYLS